MAKCVRWMACQIRELSHENGMPNPCDRFIYSHSFQELMAKKKTLTTMFEDFKFEPPLCPQCHTTENVVKSGTRNLKEDTIQLYLCKTCQKRFSDRKLSHTSYPPKLILSALTYYNMGHTLDMTIRTMRRRFEERYRSDGR